jgi:hypothetical protein
MISYIRCLISMLLIWAVPSANGYQVDILPPPGSGGFGSGVTLLPNGNFIVADPLFDGPGPIVDSGAVYLYGPTGNLISTLLGSKAGDQAGSGRVTVLTNGNYVVSSPNWDNGTLVNAGAATWCSSITGVNGPITVANSLVGTSSGDTVSDPQYRGGGIYPLTNGNYVVVTLLWDNGNASSAGAITWGNGATGIAGPISPGNSLVGSSQGDYLGDNYVRALANGNYVVSSPNWDNGNAYDAGAVTWGNGTGGTVGTVSASNSMVGSKPADKVGLSDGVTELTNGNYVVGSPLWDNGLIADAGAVTWGNGMTGTFGVVSTTNSLVGSKTSDMAGRVSGFGGQNGFNSTFTGIRSLTNGNYIVVTSEWDSGLISDVGAITWGNGSSGTIGAISASNSLIGSKSGDRVGTGQDGNGFASVLPAMLSNGNCVIASPLWDNGSVINAGAVTWINGSTGTFGVISPSNSLVGSTAEDRVGNGNSGFLGQPIFALTNGNYVVVSSNWDNGAILNAGAATWGNGLTGVVGPVSVGNSLVGSSINDRVPTICTVLTNGNFVITSPAWDNGGVVDVGAVTWGNGATGLAGQVSALNSLIGSTTGDQVGLNSGGRESALPNGNYLVTSVGWDNGGLPNVGAVTWCNGATGYTGTVSAANSLVGSSAGDLVGTRVVAIRADEYIVVSDNWSGGGLAYTGAVTWCNATQNRTGFVSAANSLVGSSTLDGANGRSHTTFPDGSYIINHRGWDNGAAINAGAITLVTNEASKVGVIGTSNSVVGTNANGVLSFAYDAPRKQMVVAKGAGRGVSLFNYLILPGEISVRQPLGPDLADDTSNLSFITTALNSPGESKTLIITNLSNGVLTIGANGIRLTGANEGDFQINAPVLPIELQIGESFTFQVSFIPIMIGLRSVTLEIETNDADESLFEIQLAGLGTLPAAALSSWTIAAGLSGENAAPDATPFNDGIENLLKYAFNMNAAGPDVRVLATGGAAGLPQIAVDSSGAEPVLKVTFLRRKGSGLIYTPQRSDTLGNFEAMTGTQTVTSIDSQWERVSVEEPAPPATTPSAFARVQVALP